MVKRPIHRMDGESTHLEMDELADEAIITIRNNEQVAVKLLATPMDLEDLAYGHVKCEGRGEIESIIVDGLDVIVSGEITPRPTEDLLTAACGACTVGDIEQPIGNVGRTQRLRGDINLMMNSMKIASHYSTRLEVYMGHRFLTNLVKF